MQFTHVITAFFLIIFSLERISNTFNKKNKRHQAVWYDSLFTSLMLFFYASIVIGSSWIFFTRLPHVPFIVMSFGLILLVIGCLVRRSVISQMGNNWCVYISSNGIADISTSGPFQFTRHPYYWASLAELIGVCLILGAYQMFVVVSFIYLPLILWRCFLEEKELHVKFGKAYADYCKRTPFFIALYFGNNELHK